MGAILYRITLKNTKYLTLTVVHFSHAVIVGDVGRAYGAYGREKERMEVCRWGRLRERDCVEDLRLDGRIILKSFFLKEVDVRTSSRLV